MAKKLNLTDLQVQSFVTELDGRDSGGDGCFGVSLCPPCTRDIPCTQTCDPDLCQQQSGVDKCQILSRLDKCQVIGIGGKTRIGI